MDYKRILKLHYESGFSSRAIAESTGNGKTTINEFLKRFRENDVLSWPLSEDISNELIGEMLYQKPGNAANNDLYRHFDEEEVLGSDHYKAIANLKTAKLGTMIGSIPVFTIKQNMVFYIAGIVFGSFCSDLNIIFFSSFLVEDKNKFKFLFFLFILKEMTFFFIFIL